MNRFWHHRRVFITGATGFIGSWLVKELLAQGAAIVAFVPEAMPESELYRSGDIQQVSVAIGTLEDFETVRRAIQRHETDTVFHLGAQTIVGEAHQFPLQTFETNIRGTYHILEACRLQKDTVQRIVLASTDKAYGEQDQIAYTEETPLRGRYPYDVSKSCADLIAQSYYHTYRLPVAITRCGNTYGGGDLNWSRIVPGTIRSFLRGERPVIRSDGTYARDYIYVKDVVSAYMRLAECVDDEQAQGEAFNFASDTTMTVLELVGAIQRLMDCERLEPDIRNVVQGEIHHQHLSTAKAKRVLGWQPRYSLEAGLKETIDWYRRYPISPLSL